MARKKTPPTTPAPEPAVAAPEAPTPEPAVEPDPAPPELRSFIALDYVALAGSYVTPYVGEKPVMLTELWSGFGPENRVVLQASIQWDLRLTPWGLFIHRAGTVMQWIPLDRCKGGDVAGYVP